MADLDEVGPGIYRIVCYGPERRISFNQFLIDDERPTLVHTGHYAMYDEVRAAIGQVLDPARLEVIVVTHFESDECGGMGRFADDTPHASLACSALGAAVNLAPWDYRGTVQGMRDGDRLELGRHTLRFIETPHVHHWDSMMVYEENSGSLFSSDLFLQPGEQPATLHEDLSGEMCDWYRTAGIFAAEAPVRDLLDRLDAHAINRVYPGHGGSLPCGVPKFGARPRKSLISRQDASFGNDIFDTPALT
jgi:flavorubredoxin